MTRTERMRITVQASIQVGTSRPITFGWEAKFEPTDKPEKVAADITDICRRVRDEVQDATR